MPIHSNALENLRSQAVAAGLLVKFAAEDVLVIAAPEAPNAAPPAPALEKSVAPIASESAAAP